MQEQSQILRYMIVGRVLFGSGLEVVCVVASRTVVKWFKGYELALAMAINMGFGRLGSALGIAVSPDLATEAVSPAVVFAASLIRVCFNYVLGLYCFFDIKIDKQLKVSASADADEEFKFSDLFKLIKNPSFIYIALLCVSFYAAVFPFIQYAPDLLINKFGFTQTIPEGKGIICFIWKHRIRNC